MNTLTIELCKDDHGQPGEVIMQMWFDRWKADQLAKGPEYFELLKKHQETMKRIHSAEMLKGQAFGL